MSDADDVYTVHAHMKQGGEIRRYDDGQWWIVAPEGAMYPGRRVTVKVAAIRALIDGTPILGVPKGRVFDRMVAKEIKELAALYPGRYGPNGRIDDVDETNEGGEEGQKEAGGWGVDGSTLA